MRKKLNLILSISLISMLLLIACGKPAEETPEEVASITETPSEEKISPIDTDEPVGIAASPEELKAAEMAFFLRKGITGRGSRRQDHQYLHA